MNLPNRASIEPAQDEPPKPPAKHYLMGTARKGKIARLPSKIRDELNCRLEDGHEGGALLEWLNALPEARTVLESQFGGVPISKQNLSEWRQGGFREWQIRNELLDEACDIADDASEIDDAIDADTLGGHLPRVVALRYAALLRQWDGTADQDFENTLRALQRLCHDALQLQKGIQRGARFKLEWQRLLEEKFQADMAGEKQRALAPIWAQLNRQTIAKAFGGGETGEKIADLIVAVNYDLPLPGEALSSNGSAESKEEDVGQTKSNQVKPDSHDST